MPLSAHTRRIALVGDLHGNWIATQALESDLKRRNVDAIYCLGDMVGKGPDSDLTYDWAMANCERVLGGNWDFGIAAREYPKDAPYYRQLGEKRMAALAALPREHRFTLSGQRIRLLHGRPVMPQLLTITNDDAILEPYFTDADERFAAVVYADAHRQAMRTLDAGYLVNIGSVGNNLGVPRVCYAILEGFDAAAEAPLDFLLTHLPYDRAQAARRCEGSDIPHIDTFVNEINTGIYSRGKL